MKIIYLNANQESVKEDGTDILRTDPHVSVGIEYTKNGRLYRMFFKEMQVRAFNDLITIEIERQLLDDNNKWETMNSFPIPARVTDYRYNNPVINGQPNPLFGQLEPEPFGENGVLKEGLVNEVTFFFMNILTNANNLPIALEDFFVQSMASRI